jgi:hypothetical protein
LFDRLNGKEWDMKKFSMLFFVVSMVLSAQLQSKTCLIDAQCSSGQVCDNYVCKDGCRDGFNCSDAKPNCEPTPEQKKTCSANPTQCRCVGGTACSFDYQCGEAHVCDLDTGICAPGCRLDENCPPDYICEGARFEHTGTCVKKCNSDINCNSNQFCCADDKQCKDKGKGDRPLYSCCSGDRDCKSGGCFNLNNYPIAEHIPDVANMICTQSCTSHTDCPNIQGSSKCGSMCTADIAAADADFLRKTLGKYGNVSAIANMLAEAIPGKCIKVCE